MEAVDRRAILAHDARLRVDAHAADRVRDAGDDVHGVAIRTRHLDPELVGQQHVSSRLPCRLDHLAHAASAELDGERVFVDEVPRARVRPLRDRLHQIGLRPRHRIGRELVTVVVEHERVPPVELRERDEALLGNRSRRRRHRAAVELVHAARDAGAARHGEAQSIPRAPRVRAQEELAAWVDDLAHQVAVSLKTAGRQDELLRVLRHGLAEPDLPGRARQHIRQRTRVESQSDRQRIARFLPYDLRTKAAQPREAVVELLDHLALQLLVTARALLAERREIAIAPDDTGREEHRTADALPFLVDQRVEAEVARTNGRAEAGHAGAGDVQRRRAQVRENVGLCSTYSMRTRSGPQRKTASVFAASTNRSTSIPSSSASRLWSSAESTRTARWLSNGRSPSAGSPSWNST